MRKPEIYPQHPRGSIRASYRSLPSFDNQEASGFSNPLRSSRHNRLHQPVITEMDINAGLQNNIGVATDLLVNQPWKSSVNIWDSIRTNGMSAFRNFSNNHSDPNVVRLKKYGMLGGSVLFVLFAAHSSIGLVKNLISGKENAGNSMIHFGDALMKWVMGAGLWHTALGKSGKFNGMNPIMWGAGISLFLNQLKGFSAGDNNVLTKASKAIGIESSFKDTIDGLGVIPKFVQKIS